MSNGPVFESGPGWGGRIKTWMRENIVYVIPGVAIVILIVVLVAAGGNDSDSITSAPTSSPTGVQRPVGTLSQIVTVRDSYTSVSRRAITAHIGSTAENETAGQRLYAETILQSQIRNQPLEVGKTIVFDGTAIDKILSDYNTLFPSQITKWEAMARNIQF